MTFAYILITCNVGKEDSVLNELDKLSNIKEIYRVHGAYDMVVKMESSNVDQANEIVAAKIRTIADVRSAMNLPLKLYN